MKILKTLSLSLFLAGTTMSATAHEKINATAVYIEYPAKTVCIKHPAAENVNTYFSEATVISFEVFKIGDKATFIKSLQSNPDVESVTEGGLTGDFQQITVTIKTTKSKAWFVGLMKKAGSRDIKINNMPVKSLDSL